MACPRHNPGPEADVDVDVEDLPLVDGSAAEYAVTAAGAAGAAGASRAGGEVRFFWRWRCCSGNWFWLAWWPQVRP